MAQSEISPDLIAAYRSTEYRVAAKAEFGSGTIILRIDEYSEPLSRLFAASGLQCAAFITACNPCGAPRCPKENLAACARLRDKLDRHTDGTVRILAGEGYDPYGIWPPEKSFLVLGLNLEASQALGGEFRQNAIVWAGPDAIPGLVLLR